MICNPDFPRPDCTKLAGPCDRPFLCSFGSLPQYRKHLERPEQNFRSCTGLGRIRGQDLPEAPCAWLTVKHANHVPCDMRKTPAAGDVPRRIVSHGLDDCSNVLGRSLVAKIQTISLQQLHRLMIGGAAKHHPIDAAEMDYPSLR